MVKKTVYSIGCLYNDHKVEPSYIMLSKTSTYVNIYDGQTKWMYFFIEELVKEVFFDWRASFLIYSILIKILTK